MDFAAFWDLFCEGWYSGRLRSLEKCGVLHRAQNDKREQRATTKQEQLQEQRQIQGFFASLRMTTETNNDRDKQQRQTTTDQTAADKHGRANSRGSLGGYDEVEGYGLGELGAAGGAGGDLILVGSRWGVAEICVGSG